MMPFLVASGGGAHDRRTDVELMGEPLTFWGGLDGATVNNVANFWPLYVASIEQSYENYTYLSPQ